MIDLYYLNSIKHKLVSFSKKTYRSKDVLSLAFVVLSLNAAITVFNSLIGFDYPYNTFLFWPNERFGDLLRGIDAFGIVDTWQGFENNVIYFEHLLPTSATIYLIIAKLILFFENKYIVLLILYSVILAFTVFISKKKCNSPLVIFLALFSYPMIFAMDRGNLAIVVFLLLLFALTTEWVILSTLAIAIATSIKITPIIFMVPVLLSRPLSIGWVAKTILFFLAWLLLINFIAIQINGNFLTPSVFDPSILFASLLNSYDQKYVNALHGLTHGSSLYMPIMYLTTKLQISPLLKSYELPILVYTVIGFCLLIKRNIIQTLNLLMRQKNILFVVSISFVLLMPVTGDYYLLILLIPLLAFPETSFSFGYFLVFGLLLGSKNILFLSPTNALGNIDISLQVFINPLLLLILLFAEFNLLDSVKRDQPVVTSKRVIIRFVYLLRYLNPAGKIVLVNTLLRVFIQLFRTTSRALREGWLRFIDTAKLYKKKLIIVSVLALIGWFATIQIKTAQRMTHNIERGLPSDFDPEIYLRLNPGLKEFWNSKGIKHESKQALLDHAELHYLGFGSKEEWRYSDSPYFLIRYITWHWFTIPILLLFFQFLRTFKTMPYGLLLIQFIRLHKLKIILAIAALPFCYFSIIGINFVLAAKHNQEIGLPVDFDPEKYLKLNPGLEKYWEEKGVRHRSKQELLNHAEIHYRDFGSKDGWPYK